VARTIEAGVRGEFRSARGGARTRYSAAVFRTSIDDDILFISAGPARNEGYFANIGRTRREGVEGGLDTRVRLPGRVAGRSLSLAGYGNVALLRATFRTPFLATSPNHPAAVDGQTPVERGDSIPGIPNVVAKAGLRLAAAEAASFGIAVVHDSGQRLRGDEANLLSRTSPFTVVDLQASGRLNAHLSLFGRVSNVLGARYETFGVLGDAADVLGPAYGDARFLSPGAPRSVWLGAQLSL
jgi:outer membrane receptor protein involved in Fe transport